jgi:hypothetical protein
MKTARGAPEFNSQRHAGWTFSGLAVRRLPAFGERHKETDRKSASTTRQWRISDGLGALNGAERR